MSRQFWIALMFAPLWSARFLVPIGWAEPGAALIGQEQPGSLHIDVPRVLLRVLVQDKRSREGIRGLGKSDFEVRDDGAETPLTYFAPETDPSRPMTIVLLLDLRVLDKNRLPELAETLKPALEEIAPSDRIAVWFMDQAHSGEVQEATSDHALVENAIAKIEDTWKTSPSFGAAPARALDDIVKRYGSSSLSSDLEIAAVTNDLDAVASSRVDALRKSLLEAPGSLHILYRAGKSDRIWRNLSSVAAPGGFSPAAPGLHYAFLSYLQKQTGGEFVEVSADDYGRAFLRVFRDLSAAYWIEFAPEPSNHAGKLHSISVTIRKSALGKTISARLLYRTGYYLPGTQARRPGQSR